MKILHVAESAKGGVGTYISEIAARQLASYGADGARVLAPDAHASQLATLPAEAIVTYPRPDRSIGSLVGLARALRETVERYQPDVIHAHSTFAGVVVRLLYGLRRDRPVIIYCPHGWSFDIRTSAWKRLGAMAMERALANLCDRIIAISAHERDLARRIDIPASKIEVVRNGLSDTEPVGARPWDDDRLKVLFVGRLDRQKGYDTLLDALAPLHNRVSVRVVGEAVANARPPEAGDAQIEMLGWLNEREIRGQLDAADVLVVPSRWEGFGLVALEAMRAGRMVIASNVGGLPEIVKEGVTGWLVPPDAPDELARRLAKITPQQARGMGEKGRRHYLALFQGERMHRQLTTVYTKCLPASGQATSGENPALN